MHILFVQCHPEPESFNAALTKAGAEAFETRGDTVEISDLYGQQFDPVEKPAHYRNRQDPNFFSALSEQRHASQSNDLPWDVRREIDRLERADLVVFQFPIWWHSIPAMLKGWFDRVFVAGGLYTSTMRYDRGYFKGKRAVCSVTSGAPKQSYEPGGRGGELDRILWATHYSLHYMGFAVLPAFATFGVQGHGFAYADDAAFRASLETAKSDWVARLASIESDNPIAFPGWGDWDETGRPKS